MIPGRITSLGDQRGSPQQPYQAAPLLQEGGEWIDQFNQHMMLTVQAVLHLHMALDAKFIHGGAHER
jgi:hypothetical protein